MKHEKNSKSETLNSKQYRNPNAQNRKEEKGLGHLKFGNLNLFRIWDLEFRICNIVGKVDALQLCIALPARDHSQCSGRPLVCLKWFTVHSPQGLTEKRKRNPTLYYFPVPTYHLLLTTYFCVLTGKFFC